MEHRGARAELGRVNKEARTVRSRKAG